MQIREAKLEDLSAIAMLVSDSNRDVAVKFGLNVENCIGVIGEHTELQRWYRKLGFKDGETKRFPHLPFSVKYMAYALQGG
jgi:hypothetical protein